MLLPGCLPIGKEDLLSCAPIRRREEGDVQRGVFACLLATQLVACPSAWASPPQACLSAAADAERRWGLPANLLLAIGQVESGRHDGATGQVQPWPWSANVGGTGYVFDTAGEAGAVVDFLRGRGVASIDVGCFQVNLRYHPAAFASVAQGFDPDANADYAGRFLRSLFERSGSWAAAIGAYHSEDRALGGDYRSKVLRAWHGLVGVQPSPATDSHVIRITAPVIAIPIYSAATLPAGLRIALGLRSAERFAGR